MNEHYIKSVLAFYDREDVQKQIVDQSYNREFALLCPSWANTRQFSTRMLKVQNENGLYFVLKALGFRYGEKNFNFYKSIAKYFKGIPNQTMNLQRRKEEKHNDFWHKKHYQYILSYDLVIDIDAPSHDDISFAVFTMKTIHSYLENVNCPHMIMFSGKGFHIYIPYEHVGKLRTLSFNPCADYNLYVAYAQVARYFYDNFSELVDRSIYDSRRLIKLAYTLSLYPENTYVAYWLNSDYQIDNFKLEDFELHGFKKPIGDRSAHLFCANGNIDKLLKEVKPDGKVKKSTKRGKIRPRRRQDSGKSVG